MQQPKVDRGAVMRRTNKVVAEGVSRPAAMTRAREEDKAARLQSGAPFAVATPRQQPGGRGGALHHYGSEPGAIAIAAKRLVEIAAAAVKAALATRCAIQSPPCPISTPAAPSRCDAGPMAPPLSAASNPTKCRTNETSPAILKLRNAL